MSCLPFPAAWWGSDDFPSCQKPPTEVGNYQEHVQLQTQLCVSPGVLTYGRDEGCVEGVVREAEQHAGLPHTRVADQQQLEQQVVRLFRH